MEKNLYVSIPIQQLERSLTERGFTERFKQPGTKEWLYGKIIEGTKFMIVIYSSMKVEGDHQRGYGEDAIRCQLQHAEEQGPLMDLAATKRVRNWEITLGEKIHLLGRLCATAKPCPECEAEMRPIRGQFGSAVLWVCFNRHNKLAPCKGVRYIDSKLANEVAKYWPRS